MTSRTIGLAIKKTSTATSTSHRAMLGSRNAIRRPNAPRPAGCAMVVGMLIVHVCPEQNSIFACGHRRCSLLLPSRPLAGRVDACEARGGVGGLLLAPYLLNHPPPL